MRFTAKDAGQIVAQLGAMSRRLVRLTTGVTDDRLRRTPGIKGWSLVDILAHLRACADLWGYSLYAMLANPGVSVPHIDERKWAKAACYSDVPFEESLQAYSLQRGNLARVLHGLAAWQSMSRNTAN